MKFFQEETNLDFQAAQHFNRWYEGKSPTRQESIDDFMKRYKGLKGKTALRLLAVYAMQCGNLE